MRARLSRKNTLSGGSFPVENFLRTKTREREFDVFGTRRFFWKGFEFIGGVPLPRRFGSPARLFRTSSGGGKKKERRAATASRAGETREKRKEFRAIPKEANFGGSHLIGRIMGGDDWLRVPNKGEVNTNATTNNATNECSRTVRSSLRFLGSSRTRSGRVFARVDSQNLGGFAAARSVAGIGPSDTWRDKRDPEFLDKCERTCPESGLQKLSSRCFTQSHAYLLSTSATRGYAEGWNIRRSSRPWSGRSG